VPNPTRSRQTFHTALVPSQWVVVLQDQEGIAPIGGQTVRDFYHRFHCTMEHCLASRYGYIGAGSVPTPASVIIHAQQSDDGATWTGLYTHPVQLQPGGEVEFSFNTTRAMARLLVYSTGAGEMRTVLAQPEHMANPAYLENIALACASYTEIITGYS